MDEEKSNWDLIRSKVEQSKYVPSGISVLRAGVASLPLIGSALDHLLFDKAETIRARNIERTIDSIGEKIQSLSEKRISKRWFESSEALEMFRQLVEKVQFEADDRKINTLADVYAVSGTVDLASDPNKFAVLRKVAELSTVQKEILLIISVTPMERREFNNGGLQSGASAIWLDRILEKVKANPKGTFWNGVLQLDVEIGILESLNLVINSRVMLANVAGYELTALGNLVVKYLRT